MLIKNGDELLSHGNTGARKTLVSIAEETLEHENYARRILDQVKVSGNALILGDKQYDLTATGRIFLIAGGKNSCFMAKAMKDLLSHRLAGGIVVDKSNSLFELAPLKFIKAGHPTPNSSSFQAGDEVLSLLRDLKQDDLLIVCVSGGWTSLIVALPQEVSPKDVNDTYDMLLRAGIPINEMNAIRNRLSLLGGGKLTEEAGNCKVLSLIAVDEVGGRPWGPTVEDNVTGQDVERILNIHGLREKLPDNIIKFLTEKQEFRKTNDKNSERVFNYVLSENVEMCEYAHNLTLGRGIDAHIISTSLEGEAKDVGSVLAELALEISMFDRPFKRPCILIGGGEPTVTITGEHGKGGRNQELALSASKRLEGVENVTVLSLGTDGSDGPTDFAGAIIDHSTLTRARDLGINFDRELKLHNSSEVFRKTGDAIVCKDTATNLMDLILIYIE